VSSLPAHHAVGLEKDGEAAAPQRGWSQAFAHTIYYSGFPAGLDRGVYVGTYHGSLICPEAGLENDGRSLAV
jgi:hypothetical protein